MSIEIVKSWGWPEPVTMRELIDAVAHEPRATELDEADRRDIITMAYRLGEPISPEHVEYIGKHLGVSQRSVLVVLISCIFSGEASMRRCACDRVYPALDDADRQCAVCELDS